MRSTKWGRIVSVGFVLVTSLVAAPTLRAQQGAAALIGQRAELADAEIESLLWNSLDTPPTFTDHGDGIFSLSRTFSPETSERLLSALNREGSEKATSTFFIMAAGQSIPTPVTPTTCIHSALSNTNLPYNYWLVVLNLGSQNVTRTTSLKLTGPGQRFNRSTSVTYNANGIWAVWYKPATGVGTAGTYTFEAAVSGGGSFAIRSFAVRP